MPYTSDDLITYLKQVDFSTTAQKQFEPFELLNIADYTLLMRIVPPLTRINEGYYLVQEDFPFVVGQQSYTLPKYAMFNKVHYVERLSAGLPYRLQRVPAERTYFRNDNQYGNPIYFYLMHDTIVFYPKPVVSTDSWRCQYYRRPGRLVLTSAAAKILSVDKITGQVTYVAAPPATFTASSTHDFYLGQSPFRRLQTNITATAIAGNVQTFPIASVQDLSPNDYVCLLDETVFPDMPTELQDLFVELIVQRLAKIQNDAIKYQYSDKEVTERIEAAYFAIGQRDTAQSVDINLYNSPFLNPFQQ